MTTVAATTGNERRNGGTVLFAGNLQSSKFNNLTLLTNVTPQHFTPAAYASHINGVDSVFHATAITMVTVPSQSSSTGYVLLTKTAHGLVVGDTIQVNGTDILNYNTLHRVTVVVSSSTVQTDVRYTVDATVAGSYRKITRNFGKMTARQYIGMIICTSIAGTADNTLLFTSAYNKLPYNTSNGDNLYGVSGVDYFTGTVTYNANRGVKLNYHDIAANNENLANEPVAMPRSVPGHIVYNIGTIKPNVGSYRLKTE